MIELFIEFKPSKARLAGFLSLFVVAIGTAAAAAAGAVLAVELLLFC